MKVWKVKRKMAKWFNVLFVAVCTSWSVGEAVSLMGDDISFPLIPTTPMTLNQMFMPQTRLFQTCTERAGMGAKGSVMKATECVQTFFQAYPQSVADISLSCRITRASVGCLEGVMSNLTKICKWTKEESQEFSSPLRALEAVLNYICNDDAMIYKEFKTDNGLMCVTENKEALQECMTIHNSKGTSLDYNEENCLEAWEFFACCEDKLYDGCDDPIVDKVTAMMEEALAVTPCINNAHPETKAKLMKKLKESQPEPEPEQPKEATAAPVSGQDGGDTGAASRCTISMVWTLLLYKLVA